MHWIPDVPKRIQDQIERESLITQRALWEVKPEFRSQSFMNLNKMTLAVPNESINESQILKANDRKDNLTENGRINFNEEITQNLDT